MFSMLVRHAQLRIDQATLWDVEYKRMERTVQEAGRSMRAIAGDVGHFSEERYKKLEGACATPGT